MRNSMRQFFTLFLGLSFLFLQAQNSSFVGTFSGNSEESAVDMVQTSNGDYYFLANTTSYGQGGMDIYLVKTNGLGELSWAYAYGTTSDDSATSLTLLSDGQLLVTGISDGYSSNYSSGLVLKINGSGTTTWSKVLSSDSTVHITDAVQTTSGDIYLTGSVVLDSLDANAFVTSMNSSGNIFWTKTYGGIKDDRSYSIDQDAGGKLVMCGSTQNDSIITGNSGDMDVQVYRLFTNGNVDWIKNYGTSFNEAGLKVKASGKDYHIAGYTESSPDNSEDILYMTVDTSGNLGTANSYSGFQQERGTDIVLKGDGGIYVSGMLEGAASSRDVTILEIGVGGFVNNFSFGGDSLDGGIALIRKSVESGYSIYSSGRSFNAAGNSDLFIIKTESDLSTGCGQVFGPVAEIPQILSNDAHNNSTSTSLGANTSLSRSSVTPDDSAICCSLQARVAADSIVMCEGDQIRLGSNAVSGYIYSWTSSDPSFTSSAANPQVSPDGDAEYKLVVSNANGSCLKDSATVYVTVNSRLSGIDFARDSFFCEGQNVTISAYPGLNSYQWLGDGYSYSGVSATFSEQDTVLLRVIDNNSCVYLDTIAVLEIPIPEFSLGPDTTICANLPITLTGPANMASYTWNGQAGMRTMVTAVQQIHELVVVDSFGCTFSDQMVLQTVPFASFDLGADTSFCSGGFFTIIGPGALSGFIWNDTSSSSANLTVFKAGTYRLTAFNSYNCPYSDTIVISEWALPSFSLGADTGFCEGGSVELIGPSGLADYLWTGGSDQDRITVSATSTISLQVTDDKSCRYTDTVEVTEYNNPVISLGPDTTICLGESISLDPGSGYAEYDWSTGATSQSIVVNSKGTYSVTVTDINGCEGMSTVNVDTMSCSTESVFLLGDESLRIYPNPARDYLMIESESSLAGAEISIHNSLGQEVFRLQNQAHVLRLDLSEYAEGTYILGINKDGNQIFSRLVVSH